MDAAGVRPRDDFGDWRWRAKLCLLSRREKNPGDGRLWRAVGPWKIVLLFRLMRIMVWCEVMALAWIVPQGVFFCLGKRRCFSGCLMIFKVMCCWPDGACGIRGQRQFSSNHSQFFDVVRHKNLFVTTCSKDSKPHCVEVLSLLSMYFKFFMQTSPRR